ncbi:MAG: DNA polymerase III [Proteobacteria bacterium]|nr:MAG: DNA polymerase III [Pseudomonadota bacterium]PIE18573.1 MAG: DNA polymerase III [Pseudomonadota bacterium]
MTYVDNGSVAAVFSRMADLMEIQGANAFRIRAFRRVAQALENLSEGVAAMLEDGTLKEVPGIGDGTIKRIREIIDTGTCDDLVQLSSELPPGLFEMLQVSGLGPKKVKLFYDELGISSIDELEAAARAGDLAKLPRMGKTSQDKLLGEIDTYRRRTGRIALGDALPQGWAIVEALQEEKAVERIDLAGSCRRGRETIGDLDVLVASRQVEPVMDRFVSLAQVAEVMLRGETKCSVRLHSGLQVDLRVLLPESYGAAMHYFTGSQMHNIAIRDRAKRAGLRINEYGVYTEPAGERVSGATEEEVFAAVGLPFIPPELRENRGEIEAAERDELPEPLSRGDLRGDLHVPVQLAADEGGGAAIDVPALIEAAKAEGLSYLGLVLPIDDTTTAAAIEAHRERVRELEQTHGFALLAAIDAPLDGEGAVQAPTELDLGEASDWVFGSVRSQLTMATEEMTARVIAALESGVIDCLAHPSGRLLGKREATALDLDALLAAAQRTGVALELDGHPLRLDLDANHCRRAHELSVPVVIGGEAKSGEELALHLELAIRTARRGWLETKDVLNCGDVAALKNWRRSRRR